MFYLDDIYYRKRLAHHIRQEGYAERWNATDLKVREHVTVDDYIKSVRTPTIREWLELRKMISLARNMEPDWLASIKYSILMFGRGEGGAPHTHGPFIMLPIGQQVSPSTLVHEKMHVYQRYHPIETTLEFSKQYPITGFEYPDMNQRANPDTTRILFGDIRPVYAPDALKLFDITDRRDHPNELQAYSVH